MHARTQLYQAQYLAGAQDAANDHPDSREETIAGARYNFELGGQAQARTKAGTAMSAYWDGYLSELGDWLLLHESKP